MEDRLLQTSEYILLRGKRDGSWPGLLREVSIVPVRRIDGQEVIDLHDSVPAEYQENAVFMMNVVTLHELCLAPGVRNLLTHEEDGSFRLLDKPILPIAAPAAAPAHPPSAEVQGVQTAMHQ